MKIFYTPLCILFFLMGCAEKSNGSEKKKSGDDKKRHWKMVTSYPRSLTTFTETAKYFTENIALFSNKKLKIKYYQPGELVPALSVFDAVSKGSVEMGVSAGYFYSGKNPAFILETGEPFGMTVRQKNAWLYEGGGLALLQDLYRKYNIMYFPFGNTGVQMGGWFRKEIKSLKDIKGLRLRVPGIGGMVYSRLGASVQVLGAGDIYPALEQGTLDGAEFVGPYDDQKLGFQNIAKYYYAPGWQESGATIALYINLKKWNELPPTTQKIIASLSKISNQMMTEKYDAYNSKAFSHLKSNGVVIKKFSDEILSAAAKINEEILKKYVEENTDFKKIYTSIKAFKKQTDDWFFKHEYPLQKFKYERRENIRTITVGKSFGLINKETKKKDLESLYPKATVKDTVIAYYEGYEIWGTKVSFQNKASDFVIEWHKFNDSNSKIKKITVNSPSTKWMTTNGIKIGNSLDQVEKINKKHFYIYPFEIDRYLKGTIQNWNNGELSGSGINLQFGMTNELPIDEYMKITGGNSIPSNNTVLGKAGLVVQSMSFEFLNGDD